MCLQSKAQSNMLSILTNTLDDHMITTHMMKKDEHM